MKFQKGFWNGFLMGAFTLICIHQVCLVVYQLTSFKIIDLSFEYFIGEIGKVGNYLTCGLALIMYISAWFFFGKRKKNKNKKDKSYVHV